MRILFLSFYYEPDFGPGAIRNTQIAQALCQHPSVDNVDVITTMPNRWIDDAVQASALEQNDNLTIHRIKVGRHKNGVVDQLRAYITFALKARTIAADNSYDVVYATSSRLATALLGAYFSKRQRALYYLDIRDLFMDTIRAFYASSPLRFFIPMLSWINGYAIRSADRINILSGDFETAIRDIDPSASIATIFNGVDVEFIAPKPQAHASRPHKELLYAGNIGFGQSLETIIPKIAPLLPENWHVTIIGDGGSKAQLAANIETHENVTLKKPIARTELIARYQIADVLLLHLGNYAAFKKSLPSKFFEYAGSGKPILAGTNGYLNRFVAEHKIEGVYFFEPDDPATFAKAFAQVEARHFDRNAFLQAWTRDAKVKEMVEDIVSLTMK